MKKVIGILVSCAIVVTFQSVAVAAEHPGVTAAENPEMKAAEHEHVGEHPGTGDSLSASEIIKGIKDHIASVTGSNGGVFPIEDPAEGKALRLKLVKVHEDKVSRITKDDAYFACTDFVTEDGTASYDIDFWMKKGADGSLAVYGTKIHKVNGTPRFTYNGDEIVEIK